MRSNAPDVHITDPQDAQFASYKKIAVQGVLGLIFGLLSPLAMVDPMLWSMPLLGVALSGWALRRIARNPDALGGRKIAMAGLVLSCIFLAAAPADWLTGLWLGFSR